MRGNSSLRRRATLGVFGGAVAFTLLVPAVAGAQTVDPYGGGNTVVTVPARAESNVDPSIADPGTESGSLPFTGGDITGLAAMAAGAVAAGALATRVRRHRRSA